MPVVPLYGTGMQAKLTEKTVSSPDQALRELGRMVHRAVLKDPRIRLAALSITRECDSRDDLCELEAIYGAVKHGTDTVDALRNGYRYVADPNIADYFVSPTRTLEFCEAGMCGGDCDDHTMLVAALANSIGFTVGMRAYARSERAPFSHVYAVAIVPKRGPFTKAAYDNGQIQAVGLDTTVPSARVGWEPPRGRVRTHWIK